MLCSGCDLIVLLKTLHHLDSEFSHEIRALAIDFLITAPSLVTSHIKDRSIYVGISQKSGLAAGDITYLAHQFTVPRMPDSKLGREICRTICLDTSDALIGKVGRDTKTCFLYEEPLHLI